jgi:hypothetical protein
MIIDTFSQDLVDAEKLYMDEMEEVYHKGEDIIDSFLKDLENTDK